jgi:HTH-type transcriptional regulator / antitoxin HipB
MHDRSFPASLAAAVRQRRQELRLHQDQLAELAQCSTRFVHTIEAGKPTVRLDKLLAVLHVLGLHLEVAHGTSPKATREDP